MISDVTLALMPYCSIREAAGQSVKSSIFHTYVRDSRDNAIMGTSGGYLKLRHEFAGVGGDAVFYKVEGEATASRQLHPGVVGSLFVFNSMIY